MFPSQRTEEGAVFPNRLENAPAGSACPYNLHEVFAFHAAVPDHFGASLTANITNKDILNCPYQLSLTGMAFLDTDSTNVKFGGQAGIISEKFGTRIGLIFSSADPEVEGGGADSTMMGD